MANTQKQLNSLGLDEKEVSVYMSLAEHIEETAYQLSHETGFGRATIYKVCDRLKKMGLIHEHKRNNIRIFSIQRIENLSALFREKYVAAQEAVQDLKLLSQNASMKKPQTRMYLGKEYAQQVWEEMMEDYELYRPTQVYATTHPHLFELFPKYFPEWIERRRALSMGTLLMYPESSRKTVGSIYTNKNEHVHFISDTFMSEGSITVHRNKTFIFTFNKKSIETIVIESQQIADINQKMLEALWSMGKE